MKILLDMNIPLSWKHFLLSAGHEAIHWRDVGDIRAPDSEIMAYARSHYLVVFTHDLDFGAILSATNASGPSVIQLRMSNIVPEMAGKIVSCKRWRKPLQNWPKVRWLQSIHCTTGFDFCLSDQGRESEGLNPFQPDNIAFKPAS